jgi:hypothetical protein
VKHIDDSAWAATVTSYTHFKFCTEAGPSDLSNDGSAMIPADVTFLSPSELYREHAYGVYIP